MYFRPLLVLTLAFVLFSTQTDFVEGVLDPQMQGQRRPMAGGWTESDLDDPMVLEAADFLLRTFLDDPSPRYSFQGTTSWPPTAKVIQASQQVVAGMNFQLTLLVQSSSSSGCDCLGAFTATVYNRFGELSVTEWKEELTCSQAKLLMEETQARGSGDV